MLSFSFTDHAIMSEIAKSFIIVVNDLFQRSIQDFPIDDLVNANQLEQICFWMKHSHCVDSQQNKIDCKTAYDIRAVYGEHIWISEKAV